MARSGCSLSVVSAGMNLVLSYRGSKDEAEQTVADVEAAGRRATLVSGDVSKPADCLAIVEQTVRLAKAETLIDGGDRRAAALLVQEHL